MVSLRTVSFIFFFFFNDTATTEIYTLSLHDALPISSRAHYRGNSSCSGCDLRSMVLRSSGATHSPAPDRKSTRLNSSHLVISYAVFCLKKKTQEKLIASVPTRSAALNALLVPLILPS